MGMHHDIAHPDYYIYILRCHHSVEYYLQFQEVPIVLLLCIFPQSPKRVKGPRWSWKILRCLLSFRETTTNGEYGLLVSLPSIYIFPASSVIHTPTIFGGNKQKRIFLLVAFSPQVPFIAQHSRIFSFTICCRSSREPKISFNTDQSAGE